MSAPDTYRSPPAPIPYDVVLGHPLVGSRDAALSGQLLGKHICKDIQLGILPLSPRKTDPELLKSNPLTVAAMDEEDVCPTCLEGKIVCCIFSIFSHSFHICFIIYFLLQYITEYDSENPKIMTKCNHHFHLSCILEWMERSDTCPICDQVSLCLNILNTLISFLFHFFFL